MFETIRNVELYQKLQEKHIEHTACFVARKVEKATLMFLQGNVYAVAMVGDKSDFSF